MNDFDKRAKKELHKRTTQEIRGLQDEIWNELEKELFTEDQANRGELKKMKKKNQVVPIILTAAAALAIVFSLRTGSN